MTKTTSASTLTSSSETAIGIRPFYIDEGQRKAYYREFNYHIARLNGFIASWNRMVPRRTVKSLADLQAIVASPVDEFRKSNPDNASNEKSSPAGIFGKLVASSQKDQEVRQISFPDGFQEILNSVSSDQIKSPNWKMLEFHDGLIRTSHEFYARQINRVAFYVITPAQKKRLAIAESLLEAAQQMDLVLQDEIEEAGKEPRQYRHEKASMLHVGPLPIALKYDIAGQHRVIKINHDWVVYGNRNNFSGLKTGSHEELFKLGVLNNQPALFHDADRKTGGALIFPHRYKFIHGRLFKEQ